MPILRPPTIKGLKEAFEREDEKPDPKTQSVRVPAEFIAHVFQLRRDMKVTIPLPPDITRADVNRLHKWMQTLPIEDEVAPQ